MSGGGGAGGTVRCLETAYDAQGDGLTMVQRRGFRATAAGVGAPIAAGLCVDFAVGVRAMTRFSSIDTGLRTALGSEFMVQHADNPQPPLST